MFFSNTAPKQCHRRQEVLCPSLSITSFTSPDFLQLFFFSYLSNSMFVSMCVFQLSRTKKLPEVPDKPRIDVKRCLFRDLLLLAKLKQPPRTLMLQCLKKTWESIDWQMIFNQNHAQDAVRPNKTQISQCLFCHLTCSGCQAFSNGVDCLDVVRDSCSCCFWGVTMGKSQILFTEKKQSCH